MLPFANNTLMISAEIYIRDDTTSRLRTQYRDLYAQLHGNAPTDPSSLTSPNDLSLMPDFSAAQSTRISTTRQVRGSLKRATSGSLRKNVRFSDNNNSESKYNRTDDATGVELDKGNRAALFPYRDDPESEAPVGPDQQNLNNQQIHAYHSSVLREQDTQLDTLGRSIGRQRDLSIQIGDELDGQAVLLDDVEQGVDRHQSQLDRGRKRLGNFARKAKDHMSFTVILILICILVLLIVLLK